MVLGIGVDCEKISRFKKIGLEKIFLNKTFTKKEICYCKKKPNPFQHLAVRFVCKEAVIKALGNINKDIFFKEIEILNNKKGAPYVKILKKDIANHFDIKISLAHSEDNAIAFAVVIDKSL